METRRKQAPLPPNGTRNRYEVEAWHPFWNWAKEPYIAQPLASARKLQAHSQTLTAYPTRITARLADGRKLVLP